MITVIELSTESLTLRPIGAGDSDYLRAFAPDWTGVAGWVVLHRATQASLGLFTVTHLRPGVLANILPLLDVAAVKDLEPLDAQGQRLHVMEEAVATIGPYLVATFALQRLGATCRMDQVALVKFYERIGMRREGLIRHGWNVGGRPVDCVVFGWLAAEIAPAPTARVEVVAA